MSRKKRKRNRRRGLSPGGGGDRSEPLPSGVMGEGSGISDLHLVRRAAREGWDVAPEKRVALVERVAAVVRDRTQRARVALAAARTLIAMDKVNLRAEARP